MYLDKLFQFQVGDFLDTMCVAFVLMKSLAVLSHESLAALAGMSQDSVNPEVIGHSHEEIEMATALVDYRLRASTS